MKYSPYVSGVPSGLVISDSATIHLTPSPEGLRKARTVSKRSSLASFLTRSLLRLCGRSQLPYSLMLLLGRILACAEESSRGDVVKVLGFVAAAGFVVLDCTQFFGVLPGIITDEVFEDVFR